MYIRNNQVENGRIIMELPDSHPIEKTSVLYEGWTLTNFIQSLLDDIQNNESWEEIDEIEVNLQKDKLVPLSLARFVSHGTNL